MGYLYLYLGFGVGLAVGIALVRGGIARVNIAIGIGGGTYVEVGGGVVE